MGAAATDLPPEEQIGRLRMPVLLLAWPQDASHPLEVAEHLLVLVGQKNGLVGAGPGLGFGSSGVLAGGAATP